MVKKISFNKKITLGASYILQVANVSQHIRFILSHNWDTVVSSGIGIIIVTLKRQPHEGENLGERIVTIPFKRVYGATQSRFCKTSGCSRQRCAVKVSNKTRLFRSHEQLRYPAKKLPLSSLADAVDADDFGGTSHLSRMDRKTFAVHRESA